MSTNYPLAWPHGWPRCRARVRAKFQTGKRRLEVSDGANRVFDELERLGIKHDHVVVSTNVRPTFGARGSSTTVDDPGVAVYWRDKHGKDRVMAVDRYDRVADNLAAIAATLEAMRAIERHGGAQILDRAFTGFVALTGPQTTGPQTTRPWREVLGFAPDHVVGPAQIDAAYKRLRSAHHPDKGGDAARFDEIEKAVAQARAEHGFEGE